MNMSHTYNMSRVSAPTRPFLNRRRSIDEKYFGANSKDSMEDFLDQMNEEMRLQELVGGETTGKKSRGGGSIWRNQVGLVFAQANVQFPGGAGEEEK